MKKYFIAKIDRESGKIEYKRYKCTDGFSPKREICWQFSKRGATQIVDRLRQEYRNRHTTEFSIEEAN